jgi:hypothetical protein
MLVSGSKLHPNKTPAASVNEQLNTLFEHARDVAGGGDGPYPIRGFAAPLQGVTPVDATIQRGTPDQFLEQNVYGPAYGAKRDAMLKAEQLPSGHPLALDLPNGLDAALSRRVFEVQSESPSKSMAAVRSGLVFASPEQGGSLGRSQHHEWRHAAFPPQAGPRTPTNNLDRTGLIAEVSGMGRKAGPVVSDKQLRHLIEAGQHAGYTSTGPELLANLGHMMGYEYGLTGKPIITPEDRIRTVQKWLEGNPRAKLNPNPKGFLDIFGGDPVMEHGPNAGQKADGYRFYEQMFRTILPKLEPQMKKDVIKAMGTLGSNEPIRPEVANAV